MNEALLQLFRERGIAHDLSSADPFSLSKKGSVYAWEGSPLHLFALEGEARHLLISLKDPLIFSFGPGAYDIALLSTNHTTLYELSEDELPVEYLLPGLHQWIESLAACFAKPLPNRLQKNLFPSEPTLFEPEEILVFTKPLHAQRKEEEVWIEVLSGELFLYGDPTLSLSPHKPLCPLTGLLWFSCSQSTQVQAKEDAFLIYEGKWKQSIGFFATLFHQALPAFLHERSEKEKKVLKDRIENQEQNLDLALQQMEAILTPLNKPLWKKSYDALQQACEQIGRLSQLEFSFPSQTLLAQDLEDKLEIICNASQIQKRKVTLKDDWWNSDHGPLLGFYKGKPVALSNTLPYEIIDGAQRIRVTAKQAQEIDPTAYTFYVPLDPSIQTGRQLIGFFFQRYRFTSLLLYSLLAGLVTCFFPLATDLLFRYAIPENDFSLLLYLTLGMLCSSLSFFLFYFLRNLAFLKLEGVGTHLLQSALWDRLLKLSPQFFRRYSVGNLFWRIASIEEIRALLNAHAAPLSLAGLSPSRKSSS
ncbi:MAG: hypothetical protein KGJ02_02580 [Verrucomicrobiota bacterium]|nr:hypothetical protein [Verrucomicrobiota bacterium]